jgi:hypothetical protein
MAEAGFIGAPQGYVQVVWACTDIFPAFTYKPTATFGFCIFATNKSTCV